MSVRLDGRGLCFLCNDDNDFELKIVAELTYVNNDANAITKEIIIHSPCAIYIKNIIKKLKLMDWNIKATDFEMWT